MVSSCTKASASQDQKRNAAILAFVTDIWSPGPQIPPANPGTISLVKGIEKMGIQMDQMAGGHGGVGNFADLAKTVQ